MSEIVIQALNVRMLATDELDELVRGVQELEPGSRVRSYNTGQKSFDPETRDVITFWVSTTVALKPLIQTVVNWVRERRRGTIRAPFYNEHGTLLKYIIVRDDGSDPEDLTDRYRDRPGRPPRRR